MFKNLLLFFVLFSTLPRIQAQEAEKKAVSDKPLKYGKIELSEFHTKPGGKDSAASAIKLFDKGDLHFEINNKTGGFRYVFVKHTRILLLKKDAYDLANIEISLYKSSNNSEEVLTGFNASTYNLENGAIAPYKIGKDAKFSDQFDKNITIRKFTLPNIKEGSIIEYKYEIRSDFIFSLRDWAFQSSIPTLLSEFQITIPEYLHYKKNIRGFIPLNLADNRVIVENFSANISNGSSASEHLNFSCNSSLLRYVAQNVPSLKDEAFITTLDDYISKIEFELNSTQYPNSPYKSYTATWDKIVSDLNDDENFGGLLKNSNYLKKISESVIKGETGALKKLNLIHDFIKQNVKYNGKESKYSGETSLKSIIEKKAGNVADINLLLVNMLEQAGLNSYPILLSTRSNGVHPGYPMIGKFNYVIAGVTIDSTKYFLDATNLNNGPNMAGFDCLNHKGLALDMTLKTAAWLDLELNNTSRSSLTYQLKLNPDNVFTGQVYERQTEYNALSNRQKYKDSASEEEFLKAYKKDRNGLKINNFRIQNLDSLSLPLAFEYTATMEDMVEEAGNLVYFTPLLYERTKENPFKLEERNFPVDFGYATEEVYRITIELPDNLVVDKLPKSEKVKLADNSASFSYMSATEGKKISIVSIINFGKSYYEPDAYFELKELFKKIVSKQAEQIILKKI